MNKRKYVPSVERAVRFCPDPQKFCFSHYCDNDDDHGGRVSVK